MGPVETIAAAVSFTDVTDAIGVIALAMAGVVLILYGVRVVLGFIRGR